MTSPLPRKELGLLLASRGGVYPVTLYLPPLTHFTQYLFISISSVKEMRKSLSASCVMATVISCLFHKYSRIYCTYMCLYLFSVTEFNHDNSVKISESDPNTFFHEVKHMWQWTVFSSKLFSRFLRINQRKNLWCTFEVFLQSRKEIVVMTCTECINYLSP